MSKKTLSLAPLEMYSLVVKGRYKKFPNNYLDKESIKVMVRYLILDSYNYTREDVLAKVNQTFFSTNQLGGARKFFNNGYVEMLIYCFPEWELKPWEFRQVNNNSFWKDTKNQKDFICWVAQKEGLDITTKEGLRKLTAQVLSKYGGGKCMVHAGGLFELLNTVAQGRYKKWEITKMVSWSTEDVIIATKWLIEEKLQYSPEQVCNIKIADFAKYNLDGMLQKACKHSIIEALELAYPGKYYRDGIRGIKYRT